jgi:hypothetical protein
MSPGVSIDSSIPDAVKSEQPAEELPSFARSCMSFCVLYHSRVFIFGATVKVRNRRVTDDLSMSTVLVICFCDNYHSVFGTATSSVKPEPRSVPIPPQSATFIGRTASGGPNPALSPTHTRDPRIHTCMSLFSVSGYPW